MVADFGIALAASAARRRASPARASSLGTPEYMSPEQALDEGADGRSDQYSLACVLFELLAGEPPYTGPSPTSIIAKRLMDPVPSVRRLRGTVPAPMDEAIVRALAKVPPIGSRPPVSSPARSPRRRRRARRARRSPCSPSAT